MSNKFNLNFGEVGYLFYYGVKMVLGDLGIKGGICIDVNGCVLWDDGSIIDGFYVVGNVSVLVMGYIYFGLGGMIGLVMMFGYLVVLYIVD